MKNKLKVTLLFTLLIFSVLLIKSSYAAESKSDFSKVELIWSDTAYSTNTSTAYEYYYPNVLHITNATYDDNYKYIGFVSTENVELYKDDIVASDVSVDPMTTISRGISSKASYITGVNFFPLTSAKELYVSIYEYNFSNKVCRKVYSNKLSRPKDIGLTRRFKAYFFNEYTSIYNYTGPLGGAYSNSDLLDHMDVSIKIGKIDDLQLLRDIKSEKADAMSRLLTYAKEDKSPVYTTSIEMTEASYKGDALPLSGKIADEQYYYVYFDNGGSGSTYSRVEDVNICYGLVSKAVGTNLFNYYDSQFKWNLPEESSSGESSSVETSNEQKQPSKLPDTGDTKWMIFASVATMLVVCAIIFKKKSKIK